MKAFLMPFMETEVWKKECKLGSSVKVWRKYRIFTYFFIFYFQWELYKF